MDCGEKEESGHFQFLVLAALHFPRLYHNFQKQLPV